MDSSTSLVVLNVETALKERWIKDTNTKAQNK